MAEIKVIALPGDVVKLVGTNKTARILDWSTQLPINMRTLEASHYAVQPLALDGRDIGQAVFWPQNGIEVLKRHIVPTPYRPLEDEVRF